MEPEIVVLAAFENIGSTHASKMIRKCVNRMGSLYPISNLFVYLIDGGMAIAGQQYFQYCQPLGRYPMAGGFDLIDQGFDAGGRI